jgi:hypothetical protein
MLSSTLKSGRCYEHLCPDVGISIRARVESAGSLTTVAIRPRLCEYADQFVSVEASSLE